MTLRRLPWDRIAFVALLVLVVLVVAACAAPGAPGASGGVATPAPTVHAPPLEPAKPGADPISFLAWIFTPIFKAMFIVLVAVYDLFTALGIPAAIGWAWLGLAGLLLLNLGAPYWTGSGESDSLIGAADLES